MNKTSEWPGIGGLVPKIAQALKTNPKIIAIYLVLAFAASTCFYMWFPVVNAIGKLYDPRVVTPDLNSWFWVGVVLTFVQFILYLAGLAKLELALADGKTLNLNEWLRVTLRRALPSLGIGIAFAFVITFGAILLIVPAIIFFGWFIYTYYLVVEKPGMGLAGYFRESKRLAKGNIGKFWTIIGLAIVVSIVLSILFGRVPILSNVINEIYTIVFGFMIASLYRYAQSNVDSPKASVAASANSQSS